MIDISSGAERQPAGYAALMSAIRPDAPADPDWRDSARCAETDPELFFPTKGGRAVEAEKICAGCPVLRECGLWITRVEAGLTDSEVKGFYAGLSAARRLEARRASRRAAA